jgi:Zn-dependent oligopeptidase
MLFHKKVQLKIDHYKKIRYYDKNQEMIQVIENENFRSKKNIKQCMLAMFYLDFFFRKDENRGAWDVTPSPPASRNLL